MKARNKITCTTIWMASIVGLAVAGMPASAHESALLEADRELVVGENEILIRSLCETRFHKATEQSTESSLIPEESGSVLDRCSRLFPELVQELLAERSQSSAGARSGDDPIPDDQLVFHEAFEGQFPGATWRSWDEDMNILFGLYSWDDEGCRPHYGNDSAWCAGTGGPAGCGRFEQDMAAYLELAAPVDLSNHTDVKITYWVWHDLSEGFGASALLTLGLRGSDAGPYWVGDIHGAPNAADTPGVWHKRVVAVPELWNALQLNFLFDSGMSFIRGEGAYVDDVTVSGCRILGQTATASPEPGAVLCSSDGRWFCWNEVPGASSYRVQWAPSPSFGTGVEEVSAMGTCYHRSLVGSGPRWWRVSAQTSCSAGQWSVPSLAMVVETPDETAPVAPVSGATLCSGNRETYKWTGVGAAEYEIQWDDTTSFSSPIAFQVVNLPSAGQTLTGNGVRYWRVRARNGSCESDWTAARSVSLVDCSQIFSDGFEGGSVVRWSDSAP